MRSRTRQRESAHARTFAVTLAAAENHDNHSEVYSLIEKRDESPVMTDFVWYGWGGGCVWSVEE